MSFANPGGLWFLLLAIPIIAFHLYRGKVRKKEVPSLLLWRMMDSEEETIATMRVLQRYTSLILNLGALLFITFAISEPQIKGLTKPKEKYVLIVDNSLSMRTREDGGTRLEMAKKEALKIMNSLGRRDEVVILDINGDMKERDLNKMDYQTKHLELADLFDIAIRASNDAKIIFISDGSGDEKLGELIKSYNANYIRVGSAKENFAIVDGNLTKGAGDKRFTLFLRLLIPRVGNLKISIDDEELGKFELQKEFSLSIPEDKSGLLTAQILSEDSLPEDNTAYFTVPPLVKLPIAYFYSEKPNKFLIDIINTLGKEGDIDLENSFSAPISKFIESSKFFTIIENCKLQQMPKEGTFLFINSGIESGRQVKDVKNLRVYKTSLTDIVEFDKLIIKEAQVSDIRDYEKPLLEVEGDAIAKVGNIGKLAYIWLGFGLDNSDFALYPAFPIFFKNVLNWTMLEAHRSNEDVPINFFDERESNIAPIEAPSTPLQIQIAKWYQDLPLENLSVAVAMLLLMTEWLLYYKGLI